MRRIVPILLLLAGCHAHQVGEERESMASAPKGQQVRSQRPVRTTPGSMIDHQSMVELQRALSRHGERVQASGVLDDATQAALRRFQKQQGQPATGLPDYDTLRRLGLDPKRVLLGGTYRREAERPSVRSKQ